MMMIIVIQKGFKKQVDYILGYEAKHKVPLSLSPICYANRKIIYSSKKELTCKSISYNVSKLSNIDGALALLSAKRMNKFARSGSTATCTLCARKITLETIGGFNKELRRYEDLDLAIKALLCNVSLISVDDNLINQFFRITTSKLNSNFYEIVLIKNYKKF